MPEAGDSAAWVERVKSDPAAYLERQAIEIILNAIALTPALREQLILKGGTLMGLRHGSPRQTADLDFSATIPADAQWQALLHPLLEPNLIRAAALLGNPDLLVRLQSIAAKPRKDLFARADFPALLLRFGYARRGSRQQRSWQQGNAAQVIEADISFNEPIGKTTPIRLGAGASPLLAYSLLDLLAEKYRAYLQQEKRNRNRRQDMYDIHFLLRVYELDATQKAELLTLLREKCQARGIAPLADSLSDPRLAERAKAEWQSMVLEIGELPDFETCFVVAEQLYRSLPW